MRLILRALAGAVVLLPTMAAASEVDAFISAAGEADIVILGEVHDNPAHHENQARIVAALRPDALVFEMVPQKKEDTVNELRDTGAGRDAIAEALEWEASGWPDFAYYAQILEAAPEARIFGGGQPAADVRRAMIEGAAGPFGPDAEIYGLGEPLEAEEREARERLMAEAHCHAIPEEVIGGMVEAQRFRDAGLADAALWARTMTGGQVVVITGNGHADGEAGVPKKLRHADPDVSIVTLGQLEAPAPDEAAAPFDHVIVTDAVEREDPCLRFRE